MQVLGNLGWLIRITIAMGFALFWGYLAWDWYGQGEYGPGMPTVIGVGVLAALSGIGALVGLVRMVTSTAASVKLPERSAPSEPIAPSSDFDADEVMARYMARREQAGAEEGEAEPTPTLPTRPQFGRKQV